MIWNPEVPTQFVVANDDDSNPSFNIWDLRNPSYPVNTYQIHDKGLLSVSWCPVDWNLVLSSGKDNRTLVTNFKTGELVLEFPTQENFSKISWSTQMPGYVAGLDQSGST
jgi:protein transport protein SEC31